MIDTPHFYPKKIKRGFYRIQTHHETSAAFRVFLLTDCDLHLLHYSRPHLLLGTENVRWESSALSYSASQTEGLAIIVRTC